MVDSSLAAFGPAAQFAGAFGKGSALGRYSFKGTNLCAASLPVTCVNVAAISAKLTSSVATLSSRPAESLMLSNIQREYMPTSSRAIRGILPSSVRWSLVSKFLDKGRKCTYWLDWTREMSHQSAPLAGTCRHTACSCRVQSSERNLSSPSDLVKG